MKRVLPIFGLAILMTACNSNPDTIAANNPVVAPQSTVNIDTVGFAQFQEYKAQNELSVKEEPKQEKVYALTTPIKKAKAPVEKTVKRGVSKPKPQASLPSASEENISKNEGGGNVVSDASDVAVEQKKEGWSKAAKGAVIGGASGAIAGAVLNKKNRAVGAVIGGVLGAGGGYVLGRGMDKKDGRIVINK